MLYEVLNQGNFAPQPPAGDMWQCLETALNVTLGWGGGKSGTGIRGWRSGLMLNILQHIGQPTMMKNNPAQSVRTDEAEKPCVIAFLKGLLFVL